MLRTHLLNCVCIKDSVKEPICDISTIKLKSITLVHCTKRHLNHPQFCSMGKFWIQFPGYFCKTLYIVKRSKTISSWQLHGSKTLPKVTTWRPCKSGSPPPAGSEEKKGWLGALQSYDDIGLWKKSQHSTCVMALLPPLNKVDKHCDILGNWSKF